MIRLLIVAALAFTLIFAGVFIVLELNKGELIIECAGDEVPIRIMQGNTVVKKLTVTKSGATVRVAAGNYVVEIDGGADGIVVRDGTVSLRRGGVETVRIVNNLRSDKFSELDSNHDGRLSPTEFGVGRNPKYAAKWFGLRDVNEDGFLSPLEFIPVSASSVETPEEKGIDHKDSRRVVEAYVTSALDGDPANAKSFAKGHPADPKQIETMARLLNRKRLAMKSVYVNDPATPTTALATSVAVKLEEKQPNGQRDGVLVLTLTMSGEGWFVTDIDFKSEEGAEIELKRFLKSYPRAIGMPPFEDSVGPGNASTMQIDRRNSHSAKKQVQCELMNYTVAADRYYPLVGRAQLARARFKCTINSDEGREVLYIDNSHLILEK